MNRLTPTALARRLKEATGELVDLVGKPEFVGAELIPPRNKTSIYNWTNVSDAIHFIGIRDLVRFEELAGRAVVTELLCKLAGGLFVPHIDLAADEGSVGWLVMRLSKELGDVSGSIAEAYSGDGDIDGPEAAAALAQLDDVDTVSAQLRAVLGRRIAEGDSA